MRQMEDLEYHHLDMFEERWKLYNRTAGWAVEVGKRRQRYDNSEARKAPEQSGASPTDSLDRRLHLGDDGGGYAGRQEPDGDGAYEPRDEGLQSPEDYH